jgi:hypothetical protein
VGTAHLSQQACLLAETAQGRRLPSQIGVHQLDGDSSTIRKILGPEDLAQPSLAELFMDQAKVMGSGQDAGEFPTQLRDREVSLRRLGGKGGGKVVGRRFFQSHEGRIIPKTECTNGKSGRMIQHCRQPQPLAQ